MLHKIFEFLLSLKEVHLEDLSRVHLVLDIQSWLMVIGLLVVVGVFGYWSYKGQSAAPGKQILMGVLRGLTLMALLLLCLRPHLVLEESKPEPSVVAVWIDDSLLMGIRDPYQDPVLRAQAQALLSKEKAAATQPITAKWPSRWEMAIDTLQNDKGLHELAKTQEVAFFTGHDEAIAQGRSTSPAQLDAIIQRIKDNAPTGLHTDIPKVIKRIFSDLQGQPVSSVIMLTDGRSSAGASNLKDATDLANAQRATIIPVPIGSKEALVNASIITMNVQPDVFVKDPVLVKIHVRIVADKAGTTHVKLYRRPAGVNDDKHDEVLKNVDATGVLNEVSEAVDYEKATKANPATEKDVELIFKPTKIEGGKAEVYHLVAKIDPIGEELSDDDNVLTAQTTVMDAKINVLYVEGYPRWEFRYLKNELLRESTINVSTLLISADENFTQEGTRRKNPDGSEDNWTIQRFPMTEEEMLKYDVILIGDVEPAFFSPTQMDLIVNFVKKHGGGVGWIAGDQYNPNSYKNTALAPLLPIDPDDAKVPTLVLPHNVEFKVKATAEGMNSPLFRFFDSAEMNRKQMDDNPSLYTYRPVLGPHGPVEVLAEHPTDQVGGQNMPLLVYGQYGDGRVLYSGYADTWRWRRYKGEPLYQSYWLQVCRMLYQGRIMGQNHKVTLEAEHRTAIVNHPMPLTVTIHDPTMLPAAPTTLTLQVADAQGNPMEPVVVSRVGEGGSTYTGEITSDVIGKLTLQVAPGSLPVDATPLELTVASSDDVALDPTIDMDSLKAYASETKSRWIEPSETGELSKLVANRSIMILRATGEDLWTKPFALVMIVLLLTAEWFLRKSSGLI